MPFALVGSSVILEVFAELVDPLLFFAWLLPGLLLQVVESIFLRAEGILFVPRREFLSQLSDLVREV